jgi:hypothetical protein
LENIASLFLGAVNNTISGHPISPQNFLCVGVCHGDALAMMVVAHGAVATSLNGFLATGLRDFRIHFFLLGEAITLWFQKA